MYLLDFGLADGLLAGEYGNCVEFVDVSVLVGRRQGLDCALNGFLLRVGMVSGEDETGRATHLQVSCVLVLLSHCAHHK